MSSWVTSVSVIRVEIDAFPPGVQVTEPPSAPGVWALVGTRITPGVIFTASPSLPPAVMVPVVRGTVTVPPEGIVAELVGCSLTQSEGVPGADTLMWVFIPSIAPAGISASVWMPGFTSMNTL